LLLIALLIALLIPLADVSSQRAYAALAASSRLGLMVDLPSQLRDATIERHCCSARFC
jgi:hypothetical protein